MNYEGSTGNLLSRTHNSLSEETFGYDNLDRLVSVKVGTKETMHIKYADNGNITSKTGIGQYYYNPELPHAVASVDNTDNLISTQACITQFNDLNKISSLQENDKVMTIDYGPDLERCFSILKQGNTILRKVTYMDDYEKVVTNGITREYYYLDGDVIVVQQNGTFHAYQSFKDNLGSILSVVDENGSKVFSAEYDAWGKQTVSVNTIGLIRGYGGHEMLNEFNLINMNGRVYDPVLGRFLSPDKYVQEGDNSQNYNSYSYCLNNPLKYADPSGDVFVLDDFIAITAMGAMMGAMNAAMSDKPIWKGALLGAASAAATYGIGQLFGVAGSFGHELLRAGAHGLSSGVFNALNGDNFWNGLISGAASSGMGSYAQSVNLNSGLMVASTTVMGGVVAWATGGDFLQGAMQGMMIGALNHAQHDQYDPMYKREAERIRIRTRDRIKKDPKYKQKIISEIQNDGKLSFEEAYYWYGYGDGSTIHVDASKLDLEKIDITNRKVGEHWSIQTLTSSGSYSVGLVYGSITVEYQGNNSFRILPDTYDFDIHTNNFFNWHTIKRNIETIGAGILHGSGTPFKIIFNGLYHNK